MIKISNSKITSYLQSSLSAPNTTAQGKAFENLICYMFAKIPGVSVREKNIFNLRRTQEIDIAFWNNQSKNGLPFLPPILIFECKNWSSPAQSSDITWFIEKLRERGVSTGVFVAKSGIRGNLENSTGAYDTIIRTRRDGIQIYVITGDELSIISNSDELIDLFKEKVCQLTFV